MPKVLWLDHHGMHPGKEAGDGALHGGEVAGQVGGHQHGGAARGGAGQGAGGVQDAGQGRDFRILPVFLLLTFNEK